MNLFKMFGGKALAVALGLAMVPASIAVPQSAPIVGAVIGTSEAQAQYYGGNRGYYRGGRGYYGGGRHFRGDRGYYRNHRRSSRNAAIGGAIAGLAVGAIIAGAASQPRYAEPRYVDRRYVQPRYAERHYLEGRVVQPRHVERRYVQLPAQGGYGRPAPWTAEWYRYCASRYRSFDARSGTFQPYNGPRQLCQ